MSGSDTENKVLRVGVIQGVKVIEERLVTATGKVTFGSAPNNTFSFPGSDLPRSIAVMEIGGGKVNLLFAEDAVGRVETAAEKHDLQSLKSKATKIGPLYQLAIDPSARGRVKLSREITVLFHFVPAPPVTAPAPLPAEVKGGLIGSIEPIFTAVLLASFIVHSGFGILVNVVEPPKPPDMEDLRRIVETIAPPKVETPKVPVNTAPVDTGPATGAGTADDTPKPSKGGGGGDGGGSTKRGGKPGGGTGSGDRAALREQIAGRGILQLIGGRGGGCGEGGAVGSVFGAGSSISDDIGSALAGTGGVGIAGQGGDGVTRRGAGGGCGGGDGSGCGGAVGIGDLGTGGGGPVDTGSKTAARIVARVRADDVEAVDGKVDKKGVAATIRRRQDAFQLCYENALKANSKLQGKLVVEFTIGDGGKVTDARVVKDGLNSAEVSQCVLTTMKRIRFPAPADGEVTISNSFVFQPGG